MKKAFLFCTLVLFAIGTCVSIQTVDAQKRFFTVTGYYSPLPDQPFFLTGSYQSEIRLNGHGKQAADGTPVFPGMVAAPKSYEFGTKVCLPNFGCGTIHDRGGAIVKSGERRLAKHDRLDLWMGYGEAGLRRALAWGVQHIEGELFDKSAQIANTVNFSVPLPLHELVDFPTYPHFKTNLTLGNKGDAVWSLQDALVKLGATAVISDGVYDKSLQNAVLEFQLKYFVVEDAQSLGAGRFGPKTRAKLAEVLYQHLIQQKVQEAWAEFSFEEDQARGKRNADIVKLQQILVKEELLNVRPTGFFGPLTEQALTDFQLRYGIIQSAQNTGAGKLGPQTRARLNEFIVTQRQDRQVEQEAIFAFQKVKRYFDTFAQKPSDQLFSAR